MGIRSTLVRLLAGNLDARVRDAVDGALAGRDLAERADAKALADTVVQLQSGVAALGRDLTELRAAAVALAAADDVDPLAEARARLDALATQVVSLDGRVGLVESKLDGAQRDAQQAAVVVTPKATAAPAVAAAKTGCKVPGCTGQHRARGFCGKHYQMWTRGTLPGFGTNGEPLVGA